MATTTRRLAVAAATAATAVVISGSPAHADVKVGIYVGGISYAASAKFVSKGETLTVGDHLSDGVSAVGRVRLQSGGAWKYCWNSKGSGTSTTCNFSFPEGRTVIVQVLRGKRSTGELYSTPIASGTSRT